MSASNYPPGVTGHEPQIAGPSREYESWLEDVDLELDQICSLSLDELPDVLFSHDAFDDGDTPYEFACKVLAEAGFTL